MNERTMSKKQELAVLDKAIAELGDGSYLGGWLKSVRDEVESTILSDIMPDSVGISIARSRIVCEAMVEAAKADAKEIVDKASDRAAQIAREARSYKDYSAEQLRKALRILEG